MTLTAHTATWVVPVPPSNSRANGWLMERRLYLKLGQDEVDKQTRELGTRVSQSYLSQIERGTRSLEDMGAARMDALRRVYKLSPEDWAKHTGLAIVVPGDRLAQPSSALELNGFVQMPIYALASAGLGATEVEPLHKFAPLMMPVESWHPALRMFLAVGHSMDSGREDGIRDGDTMHVDMRDMDPVPGRVCIVEVSGRGVFVKRIKRLGGGLWLVSDNPDDAKYPDFQVEEARILGTVYNVTRNVKVRTHLS